MSQISIFERSVNNVFENPIPLLKLITVLRNLWLTQINTDYMLFYVKKAPSWKLNQVIAKSDQHNLKF